jgi:hypothetical protein
MGNTIYADSFGGITAAEQNAAAQRDARLQHSIQNFQAGMAAAQKQNQFNRELALRKATSSQEMDLRGKEFGLRQDVENRRSADEQEKNQISRGYLDVQKDIAARNSKLPTPGEQRERDLSFTRAASDAETGLFEPSLYPHLSSEEQAVLTKRTTAARSEIENNYQTALNAANTLNARDQLVADQAKLSKIQQSGHHMFWPDSENAKAAASRLDKLQPSLEEIVPKASRIAGDKRISALITFDPTQSRYVPAVPAPSWKTAGSTSGSTGGRSLTQSYNVPDHTEAADEAGQSAPQTDTTGTTPAPERPMGPPAPIQDEPAAGMRPGPIQDEPPAGMIPAPPNVLAPRQATGKRQYEDYFYSRVNELIGSGMPPAAAKMQALQEREVGYR